MKTKSYPDSGFGLVKARGVTEQSTLDERGEFHENLIPILSVECSCIYNTYRTGYVF